MRIPLVQTIKVQTLQRIPSGKVIWAVREEMARTVEDVLSRRTRALLLDAKASISVANTVAGMMAEELGYDSAWINEQVTTYTSLANKYLI